MSACRSCATELPDDARFCFNCGATHSAPVCGSCGAALVAGARFCMECGASRADTRPAAQPVAARRVTSVLFGDLVGFTTLSESRDQEETRELLSSYFDSCRRVIERYGGTVEKYIGDAVMAVWGVPTAHEDDAERAVRAGLELANVVTSLGEEVGVGGLAMRVGIVTGEVAVTLGAENQGMVAGDAVNTAARVQSVTAPGQVWVDETTKLLTSAAITYLDAGSHVLKGKADPVPLWSVRAVVAAVGGAQRADGLEAPLVGRERELRLCKELFHRVEESARPALLVMVGEPGVGKTRLAWEFEKYVDGLQSPVRWHAGRCVAYGEGVAYYALAEAFRGRLQLLLPESDDGAEDDPTRLMELALTRYVPDETERDWIRPRLAALLGTGSVGTFPREDLFSAWTAFLQRVGEDHPVVLLIDDAQHADDGLLQFVEHLLGVATFPCFVVLLSRPGLVDKHPGLATNRGATVSHLEAMSDRQIGALLDGLVAGVPELARESLIARSEGIPLFAVETVRSLIDRDLVVPRGGQYVLNDPDGLDLDSIGAPASLQALIAARLDALDPGERRVVDLASVLGNVFSREQIVELCEAGQGVDDVEGVLASLVRLQILSVDSNRFSAGYGRFQFVQTVVRQVAYGTLSRRDRKRVHLAVAAQLAASDSADDLAAVIAQHLLDAVTSIPGDADVPDLEQRAITQLELAAARARALGALTESAGHLQTALARATEPVLRARLESGLAYALLDAGDYEQAAVHARTAMEAFDACGDRAAAGIAAATYGDAIAFLGDTERAVEVLRPWWEALAGSRESERAQLRVGQSLIGAEGRRGQLRMDVMIERIRIAERLSDHEHLADALTALSVDYSWRGAPHTAKVLMAAAADLARTHHLPVSLARCLSNLTVAEALENLPRALSVAHEGVEVADRAGVAMWRDYTRANLVLALMSAGRWEEMDEVIAASDGVVTLNLPVFQALALVRADAQNARLESLEPVTGPEHDDPTEQAWWHFLTAMHAVTRGDRAGALPGLLRCVDLMIETAGVSDDLVQVWPVAVDVAMREGDRVTVDRLVAAVDEQAERVVVPLGIEAHRRRVSGLMAREGDPDEAEELLRSALDMFDVWGAHPYRARTEVELGSWLLERGHQAEGSELVERGRATLAQLGARGWLEQLGFEQAEVGPVAAPPWLRQ